MQRCCFFKDRYKEDLLIKTERVKSCIPKCGKSCFHPFIHRLYPPIHARSLRVGPISSGQLVRGRAHLGQVASPSQENTKTHNPAPKGNLERPTNLTVMSSDCGRNRSTQREPMHEITCRKSPGRDLSPRPS
ncbi:hypothetical protein ATANTOWER_028074 [Ataeniobius toweri]|uniref:Uncharacterized protein n=1 Tax=Ataeniobius toweri TaxID=208326 RepID=A0ABU7BB61_9TELE|nr:hypothetical protein [Ataeniobius toweri]